MKFILWIKWTAHKCAYKFIILFFFSPSRLISLGSNESFIDTKFYVSLIAIDSQHVITFITAQSGLLSVPDTAKPTFRQPHTTTHGPNPGQLSHTLARIARPLVEFIATLRLVRGRTVAGGQQPLHFRWPSGQQGLGGDLHLTMKVKGEC